MVMVVQLQIYVVVIYVIGEIKEKRETRFSPYLWQDYLI